LVEANLDQERLDRDGLHGLPRMVAVRTLIRAFNSKMIIWDFCGRMITVSLGMK
jgi:hypothetical protein